MYEALRRRVASFEAREASGENVWTTSFSSEARTRLVAALEVFAFQSGDVIKARHWAAKVDAQLRLGAGITINKDGVNAWSALTQAVMYGSTATLPSLIEAALFVTRNKGLHLLVEDILLQERVAYKLVGNELYPFQSLELHQEVVAPTLALLAGRPELADVEASYQSSLREIGSDPGDAITDAGRALQAMLESLGLQGNTIGALLKSARHQGYLASHDQRLADAIIKLCDWVSADRSEKGDAHKLVKLSSSDAWLTVHVVGALIVRLSEPGRLRSAGGNLS